MKHTSSQSGNILFIILIAVAVIAALGAVMMNNGGSQASSMASDQMAQKLKSQIDTIKSALNECNLVHEFGYPATDDQKVVDLECQIDATPTFVKIFSGADIASVVALRGFSQWTYNTNGTDTISIHTEASGDEVTNPVYQNAVTMLASQYSPSEAEFTNDGNELEIRIYLIKP
jgi:hypothetical protein